MQYDENIYKKLVRECRENIKINIVRYAVGCPVVLAYISLGSLLFIYTEHCWDNVQEKQTVYEFKLFKLCKNIVDHLEVKNETTLSLSIIKRCNSTYVPDRNKTCEVTMASFVKWSKFTSAVCYTVGRFWYKFFVALEHKSII